MGEVDQARITDKHLREQALLPDKSFVIQAPAGSGKTELLTQRYLRLLAAVEYPEEILAVTFTRKAAAEMRNRILDAMYPPPGKDKRLPETIDLANTVLERDKDSGWQLARYPARLRVRTIDSANAWLSATAPLLGGGGTTTVSETPVELYRLAAQRAVEQAGADNDTGAKVRSLLLHLDNRGDLVVRLLAGMLERRDQWLGFVVDMQAAKSSGGLRAELERVLHGLVTRDLRAAYASLNDSQRKEIFKLAAFAATNLFAADPDSPWSAVAEAVGFPEPVPDNLNAWRLLAEFLLKQDGGIRKTVNARQGFPPGKGPQKKYKDRAVELFGSLAGSAVKETFGLVRELPAPCYGEEQWETLEALLDVLRQAAAELFVVFDERGESDYTAVAQSAINALVDEDDMPTDLALRLDFRIRHILIDEFQDTSSAQLKLVKSLTAGWQEGDGRTLFVVGDPMQSIYRFRKAEVGLFMELQRDGLPNLDLQSITLETNFRSDPEIMNWVNTVFARVMPAVDDLTSGAVSYAPGAAARVEDAAAVVEEHALIKPSRVDEAKQVVALVARTLEQWPKENIGILVRSRRQAALIVNELRKQNIRFAGTGLENPVESPVVQDLLCLTRALSHRGDRTAWLGLLRAPWCGLSLADLEALAGSDRKACIWDLLNKSETIAALSADGRGRVERLKSVLAPVFARRGSLPLRDVVEGVWVELGGPAFLEEDVDLERASAFFTALDQFDTGGDCADAFDLHGLIKDRLKVEEQDARVNLLTIHKAKGLQFHTVILPALEAGRQRDKKPVLAWQEVVQDDGSPGLVIAPVERMGDAKDGIFELARRLNAEQDENEQARLLYVATTRARKRLHLFFGLKVDPEKGVAQPAADSLLKHLWPAIGEGHQHLGGAPGTEPKPDAWLAPRIRRYREGWEVPAAPEEYRPPAPVAVDDEMRPVSYDWVSPVAKHIGTVVHAWLQRIAEEGIGEFDAERLQALRPVFANMLLSEKVPEPELDNSVDRVETALRQILDDEKGRWILGGDYETAAAEYPVSLFRENRLKSYVIDRTFVDAEGIRWIIDYKSSAHEGGGLEDFIDSEVERYAPQLANYRNAMQLLEPERTVRTALYFPLLGVFREVGQGD
ncbi:MAG: UvrD-helicase domain-containing protein [Gammaproteobacteria bacterium]|nr:UvrD-helicase domain-containing protein [Gammaproteobacteria bacterium]